MLFVILRLQWQLVLQLSDPTSPAGVPCSVSGIGRSLALVTVACMLLQVWQIVPSCGVSVRQMMVPVSVSLFLGEFTCLKVLYVVRATGNVCGLVRLMLLAVTCMTCCVRQEGL